MPPRLKKALCAFCVDQAQVKKETKADVSSANKYWGKATMTEYVIDGTKTTSF